jgi:hypothetical protein
LTHIVAGYEANPAHQSMLMEKAMNSDTDPVLEIKGRIRRRMERIARWDKEAEGEVGSSWSGAPAYIEFCQQMAAAARKKIAELETELELLQA